MKLNANSVALLYRMGKITIDGVRRSCTEGWITVEEYKKITGEEYE